MQGFIKDGKLIVNNMIQSNEKADLLNYIENNENKIITLTKLYNINGDVSGLSFNGSIILFSDLVDDTNQVHKFVTVEDKQNWDSKANISDIPTNISELNNDSNFIDKNVNDLVYYTITSDMNNAISNAVETETTNRQNADIDLQRQIDAIVSASDVVDVISSYTDLQNYDTTKLTADDVVKVMQDSSHSDAISYYRWTIINEVGTWVYVGSEGPYFTKSETETLVNGKYTKPNSGIPKTDLDSSVQTSLGKADSAIQDVSGKEDISNKVTSISSSSTDTQYPSAKCVYDIVGDINSILDDINGEVV